MDDKSRAELAAKLDEDLDEFVSNLKPSKYEDGWPEDRWEEEMEKHPFFMKKPLKENEEVPPLVEALQQLKYDPDMNTPEELAESFKQDGNQYFKVKKYRWAVESYSQGLNAKAEDSNLNGILFANRAAAHFHIGNYKKSLDDCIEAKKLSPSNLKAIRRGAQCCLKLKEFEDAIAWCTEGLKVDASDSELGSILKTAKTGKLSADRDKRKAAVLATRQAKEEEALKRAMKDRGIKVTEGESFHLSDLEPDIPSLSESRVRLDVNGCLVWPVLLLYPEHGASDYIQAFYEDSCLNDHLKEMLNEDNRPAWDSDDKYRLGCLQAYFASNGEVYVKFDVSQCLRSILSHKRFTLHAGTPCFFITVKDSAFDKHWIKNHVIIPI